MIMVQKGPQAVIKKCIYIEILCYIHTYTHQSGVKMLFEVSHSTPITDSDDML